MQNKLKFLEIYLKSSFYDRKMKFDIFGKVNSRKILQKYQSGHSYKIEAESFTDLLNTSKTQFLIIIKIDTQLAYPLHISFTYTLRWRIKNFGRYSVLK